jgi:hypothetical protein
MPVYEGGFHLPIPSFRSFPTKSWERRIPSLQSGLANTTVLGSKGILRTPDFVSIALDEGVFLFCVAEGSLFFRL